MYLYVCKTWKRKNQIGNFTIDIGVSKNLKKFGAGILVRTLCLSRCTTRAGRPLAFP